MRPPPLPGRARGRRGRRGVGGRGESGLASRFDSTCRRLYYKVVHAALRRRDESHRDDQRAGPGGLRAVWLRPYLSAPLSPLSGSAGTPRPRQRLQLREPPAHGGAPLRRHLAGRALSAFVQSDGTWPRAVRRRPSRGSGTTSSQQTRRAPRRRSRWTTWSRSASSGRPEPARRAAGRSTWRCIAYAPDPRRSPSRFRNGPSARASILTTCSSTWRRTTS